jgi:hypothetical protein
VGASKVVDPFNAEPTRLLRPGVFNKLVNPERFEFPLRADIKDDPSASIFEDPQPANAGKIKSNRNRVLNGDVLFIKNF